MTLLKTCTASPRRKPSTTPLSSWRGASLPLPLSMLLLSSPNNLSSCSGSLFARDNHDKKSVFRFTVGVPHAYIIAHLAPSPTHPPLSLSPQLDGLRHRVVMTEQRSMMLRDYFPIMGIRDVRFGRMAFPEGNRPRHAVHTLTDTSLCIVMGENITDWIFVNLESNSPVCRHRIPKLLVTH